MRHAVRGRNGAAPRRRPAPEGRRRGGARLPWRAQWRPMRGEAMTPEQIDQAAQALMAGRNGQPIPAIPDAARPQSEADSYAIQDAVMRRLGERAGGWKVGYSPEGGIFCAPIYASKIYCRPGQPAGGGASRDRDRVRDRL